MELLNIRFSFLCRTTRTNAEGKHPIVLRIVYRSERRDLFTGLHCAKDDWDSQACRLKKGNRQFIPINQNLDLIIHKAHNVFEQLKFSGQTFTLDELVDKLKGKEERPALLIDYLQDANEKLKCRLNVDITKPTYEKYVRSANHMLRFLETTFKVKNYALQKMDGPFLEKYFQYLRSKKNISHNSSVKYLVFLKTILKPAIKSGMIKHDPFQDFKVRLKPVYKGYLTEEEINRLSDVKFESRDLDRIRDIFLFACYTGLAYADIKQLTSFHIMKDTDDSYYIRKPRQKTGQESIIPLVPAAMKILQKYSLTDDFRDFSWHVSANQKMNQRLKTIGAAAGIEKPLHMHLARHTFATTITLSNGVPIESVSSMLGHASLKQTQHYAKIVALKIKNDMARVKELYK